MKKNTPQLEPAYYSKVRNKISFKIFDETLLKAAKILVREKKLAKNDMFNFELTFVGDKSMQSLNKEVHKKDRSTDVISLSYIEDVAPDNFIGEVFICVPYAKRQAKKIGQTLEIELQFLFTHGLLHIFGYDHMKPDEEREMLRLTYEILGRSL